MTLISRYESYIYNDYFKTELPKHWSEKCLGYLADHGRAAFVDGPFGSDLKSSDYIDNGVPLIQLNNIRDSKHLMQNMKFITEEKKQQLIRHLVIPNDIVIAKMAEPVARCAIVIDEYAEYVIVADCVKLTPNLEMVDRSYLVWAINSENVKINAELVSTGTTRIRINLGELKKLKVPYPPMSEQIKIAHFLDHKTAKIDTLIDKQQQLIELLKEKRQAVISHAVTKGLNPNAPMRDSGVEWLGEVPEHWEIKKLKYLVNESLMYGANEAALDVNFENPRFVRITDVKDDGSLKDDTFRSLNEELAKPYLLKDGDILLARTGGTVGKSFMYSESWGRCCFAGYLIKASLNQSVLKAEWFYRYTQTQYYWEWIASSQIQATLPNVSADKYNGFLIAVPPIKEQIEILNNLQTDIKRFDEIISKAELVIQLMKERRTALISAAVTGKIDVRDWQAPEAAEGKKAI